jgi:hypothetical protein
MAHYNTNNLSGEELKQADNKTESQKERIYQLFKTVKTPMNWCDVKAVFIDFNEISIKRSMSDLKNELKLIKTDIKELSIHNAPCYKYKLNN